MNNELLFRLIESYLHHKNFNTQNPEVKEMQEMIIDVDIAEMWLLTQGSEREKSYV